MIRTKIIARLFALAALGWLMAGSSALQAQPAETNATSQTQTNEATTEHTFSANHHDHWTSIGKDVELASDDSSEEVVVIGGNAKIHGHVDGDVIIIGGDAVIDGKVEGQVVTIMGDVQVGSKARIGGQLVAVGGGSHVAEGGKVEGQIVEVFGGNGGLSFLQLRWLRAWITQCVMKLRPLAPSVGFVWWIAGFFFLIYLLIAVLFPHPVQCCAAQVSARPATTFAAGVLMKIAIPFLCLILPFTILGIFIVPFLVIGACLTAIVGKVSVLDYIGGKIGLLFGLGERKLPLVSFLIGSLLITLLYMVPIIGLLTLCVFSCWGLGAGVMAVCVAFQANRRAQAAAAPAPPSAPSAPAEAPPQTLAPPQALAYPRAGFWERMGAGFLDLVLICLTSTVVGPFFPVVAVAYFAGLWAWKGTTVGGIVLNLQVVRLDGQRVGFLSAFVRSLASFFSAFMLFLGFFWIGWDSEKQGWHDKIAGTVVVRLPKSVALVCF